MNVYAAIPHTHKTGLYMVAIASKFDNTFRPCGGVRSFDTFDEANQVARDIADGKYPNAGPSGRYINMR